MAADHMLFSCPNVHSEAGGQPTPAHVQKYTINRDLQSVQQGFNVAGKDAGGTGHLQLVLLVRVRIVAVQRLLVAHLHAALTVRRRLLWQYFKPSV